MRRAETLGALALFVGALVMIRQALKLPIGWTAIGPGSGFFPFWLGVGVAVFAGILLVGTLRPSPARSASGEVFLRRQGIVSVLAILVPLGVLIALLDYLGLYIGGALYLAGYTVVVGRHRWVTGIAVSVAVPLFLFFFFERWFLLPLPKGVLLEYLLYRR